MSETERVDRAAYATFILVEGEKSCSLLLSDDRV